eukprot:1186961-Prorocentrum_minimum.AAC.3
MPYPVLRPVLASPSAASKSDAADAGFTDADRARERPRGVHWCDEGRARTSDKWMDSMQSVQGAGGYVRVPTWTSIPPARFPPVSERSRWLRA